MTDPEQTLPPTRRASDLPPGAPWWALWIEAQWPIWSMRVKRTGATLVIIAPQLYEYLPQLGFDLSSAALHNLTSLLGLVVLFGTLDGKIILPKKGTP